MMAHLNVAGVHVPIWLDSPISAIGYGSSSSYPNEEGTFFGNIFITSNGKVPAYYCEGGGFAKGIVPGRLGATTSAAGIFTNPFGSGALCSAHCSAASGSSKGQGYASCNGYTRPITVWRAASYRPVFDPIYVYRFINSQSALAMDVAASSTANGASVIEYVPSTTKTNQQFQIVLTASSTWKLIALHSGKSIAGTGSNDQQPGAAEHLLRLIVAAVGHRRPQRPLQADQQVVVGRAGDAVGQQEQRHRARYVDVYRRVEPGLGSVRGRSLI